MAKADHILKLLQLFREHGYDGATLSKIAQTTGLGKASLYHHFPGGKDEMVDAVLGYISEAMDTHILQVLRGEASPRVRFAKMCDGINTLYRGGEAPCMTAILLMGSARPTFHAKVRAGLQKWMDAIARVLIEAKLDETLARQRAEDALIAVEGALILSQALNDFTPFQRVVSQLPQQLCQDLTG